MIKRRAFLIGCGGIVAAPVFAQLALPPTPKHQPQALAAALPALTAEEPPANPEKIALRIDGWEITSDAGTEVWVQINSSWRATWR